MSKEEASVTFHRGENQLEEEVDERLFAATERKKKTIWMCKDGLIFISSYSYCIFDLKVDVSLFVMCSNMD